MCGRYASMRDTADLVLLAGAADETATGTGAGAADDAPDPVRSANVAPTDRVRVLLNDSADMNRRVLRRHVWGLIPPWSPDRRGAARMINARVETIATKPSFRRAVRTSRCLVPADGWYEWRQDDRVPHLVYRDDGDPLWLAGVWARWHPADGGAPVDSVSILTRPAPPELTWLHSRAPVVVADIDRGRWLDAAVGSHAEGPVSDLLETVLNAEGPALRWHVVSRAIGQVRRKDPQLMEPEQATIAEGDAAAGPGRGRGSQPVSLQLF